MEHCALGTNRASQTGPMTRTLIAAFALAMFFLRVLHDQRNTLNAGFEAQLPWRAFASMNLYYGSGFSNGSAPPSHLPSDTSVDLAIGKTFGERLSASLTVLNLADRRLLLDNSETFGGTHVESPREIYAEIHYRFRY